MFTNTSNRKRRPGGKFLFALFFPLLIILLGFVVMWLWNSTLAEILPVNRITYWQALGLFLLCRILFGGFGFRKKDPKGFGGPGFGSGWRGRWQNMSEEERANLKSEWRKRCQERKQQGDKPFST